MVVGLSIRRNKRPVLDEDEFYPEQFEKIPHEVKIPWKAIALAVFLLTAGSVCLFLSLYSNIPSEAPGTLLTLGLLMFIPGFYHVRLAYYAFKGYPGYSFEDLPDFD